MGGIPPSALLYSSVCELSTLSFSPCPLQALGNNLLSYFYGIHSLLPYKQEHSAFVLLRAISPAIVASIHAATNDRMFDSQTIVLDLYKQHLLYPFFGFWVMIVPMLW